MTGPFVNPLQNPGTAALTFKSLQASSRFHDVLASLRAVQVMHNLPRVAWSVDSKCGVTGTVRGSDDDIVDAVWAWADAFAMKVVVEPAEKRMGRSRAYLLPGSAVVHLSASITIGGRLVNPETGQ